MLRLVIAAALMGQAATPEGLLRDLQRAIDRGDRQAVAALVDFPLTARVGDVRVRVEDAAMLARQFESIFTSRVLGAIRDGSAIRENIIEVEAVRGVFRITRVSALPELPAASRSAARPRPGSQAPRRVAFSTVQQTGTLTGTLAPGESEFFLAYVEKNRLLITRIDGVRGRDIVLKVFDHKSGKPLDERSAEGLRTWSGRVPESADYRIQVLRPAAAGDALLPYTLVVMRR